MKKLLFLTLMVPAFSWAQCANRVDPNNVVLFIDTNTGDGEIAQAQRGACASGRRLVVIPRNYREHGQHLVPWLQAYRAAESSCKTDYSSPACQSAQERVSRYDSQYSEFVSRTNFSLDRAMRDELSTLQRSGAKVSSMILSGHDGGGHFSGKKGGTSRSQLSSIMSEYPGVNNIQSVILAGCFTGTQAEIPQWKSAFPDIKSLYGYDGYAPLSDRPAGHQYISSALTHDRRLRSSANVATLNQRLRTLIPSVGNLNAAAHLQLDCNEEAYMASASGRTFASVGRASECQAAQGRLSTIASSTSQYLEGTMEPPTDSGTLRQVYMEARRLQHCVSELGLGLSVDQLFNIRFYPAIETNFALFYAQDLANAEQMLADVPADVKGSLWIPNRANLESKTRAEALRNINQMYNVLSSGRLNPTQTRAINWLISVSTRHIQSLENPFEWHEVTGESPIAPQRVERLTR